ncbi:hypothetical protein INS49_000143 [Diaporthe citri]|uniref:uncharacterized protein n=1 Tax=Diaporthe citri TaxID=83186 RepID=UPI001C800C51|nr:uncharacterized protein INS49_000143 [Diaporthe citri]KAG6365967.1 hypothetical protein INS49_000143 [Diaporthe citri]
MAAAASLQESPEWDLPKLRSSFNFEDDYRHLKTKNKTEDEKDDKDTEFFDVKFYPYDPDGADPVFAAVSKKHVHFETERPLLCVAGSDAKVKVYDIKEGKIFTTLVGHGGEINDLATSPQDPRIIASASDDTTIRIWSLGPAHAKQPCLCLLGGEGHSWSLLSIAFHNTGRYMLSAGHDQVVNLWTIPDLPEQHVDTPIVVHYPHFSTSDVHFGLIDCVAFYGDLILSRACHEDKIVLWKIEGFSSEDPPPPPSTAPTAYDQSRTTRSAFASINSPSCPSLWVRLLQFETPHCGPQFFLRFSLHHVHGHHPILVFCNTKSEILMWDMARLTGYQSYINKIRDPNRDPTVRVKRPLWLQPNHHKMKKAVSDNPVDPVYTAAFTMRPVGHRDPFNVEGYLLEEQSPRRWSRGSPSTIPAILSR